MILEYKNVDLTKYNEFIDSCRLKCYEGTETHDHHILPKFMKGTNHESNLIKLSYEDHQLAHLILAECFNKKSREYIGNMYSVNHLNHWILDPNKKIKLSLKARGNTNGKKHKGRIPWNKGIPRTEEAKRKISEAIKNTFKNGRKNIWIGKKHKEESKQKMSQSRIGSKLSEESIKKRTISRQNNGKPWFTDSQRQKMSEIRKGKIKTWVANKHSVKHIETGLEFITSKSAKEYFNLKRGAFYKAVREGIFQYI